jgi:hypothetical protein
MMAAPLTSDRAEAREREREVKAHYNARRLDRILDELSISAFADAITVFGSVTTNKPLPADIDIFIDLHRVTLPPLECGYALRGIIALAYHGGYHGNYGFLDPFYLTKKNALFTRDASYPAWVEADKSTAAAIITAGRAGIPILSFSRRYAAAHPLR